MAKWTSDERSVRSTEAAFGRPDEADLVDQLRAEGVVLASLVAEFEKRIVGHILFSRMWIETTGASVAAVALAPVAVLPEHQRRGIGGQLIRHGLNLLRRQGEKMVIVLSAIPITTRASASPARRRLLWKVHSLPAPLWRWNSARALWTGFTARSDIRPRSDSEWKVKSRSTPLHRKQRALD